MVAGLDFFSVHSGIRGGHVVHAYGAADQPDTDVA